MVDFGGVGQLLGARAFTGGQLAGVAAGQQDAERRRQQEFLNFFRVQQAQQQQAQFQEQQAFRQTMFERQFGPKGLQERRFGLAEEQFESLKEFREKQLDIQKLKVFGSLGLFDKRADIADLLGPRLTEEQARVDQIAQLKLEQRGELAAQRQGRAAAQPRLSPEEFGRLTEGEFAAELERSRAGAAPQPVLPTGLPAGVRAAPQPTLREEFDIPAGVRATPRPAIRQATAIRRGRAAGLTRKDIIRLSVKATEGDRASALILANAGISGDIFGPVQTPGLVAGAKEALKERKIIFGQATQRQILDALQPPLSGFERGLEILKGGTLPFGAPSGINVLREQTGFTQPTIQQNLQELQTFLREIKRAPIETRDVQDDDVRAAILFRDRLLQLQRRFDRAKAGEFNISLLDAPFVGPRLAKEFEGLRQGAVQIGEDIESVRAAGQRFGLLPPADFPFTR